MIAYASPNIAFLKYWGKLPAASDEDRNLATNPSLSLTLSQAQTECEVKKISGEKSFVFINEAPASEHDYKKVCDHLVRIQKKLNLSFGVFEVRSKNNFPAGTGLASSASAFAALTLATLGELEGFKEAQKYLGPENSLFSELARRGSGSAARSVQGGFMLWENRFAKGVPSTWSLRDTIIIVSKKAKKVSSTDGHALAPTSPLFEKRLLELPARLERILSAVKSKDLTRLGPLLEEEALELHSIAATCTPSVQYGLPETHKILEALQSLSKRDYFFTLDAGPNVHVISERPIKKELQSLLSSLKIEADIWEDWRGEGPVLRE